MAYNVSNKYREQVYSGSSTYKCQLTINGNSIPNNQIERITISNPIIDDNKEYFYIGTFISQKITIKFRNLNNLNIQTGDNVELSIGQLVGDNYEYVPIGKFIVDELTEDYYKKCEIPCLDYAIKFKPNVDYREAFDKNGKTTLKNLLIWLCKHYGVQLGTYPTVNNDVEIGIYDNTISGKAYISYIAEMFGGNAKIDRNGILNIISLKQKPVVEINALKSKTWELKERFKISKVVYDNGVTIPFNYGEDTYNTLYIRNTNVFVSKTEEIENIYNAVKDVEIWSLKNENYGDISLDSTDYIKFNLGNNSYNTLNNYEITYAMTIMTKIETNIPTKQQETTTNVVKGDSNDQYSRLKTIVDLINNELQILSEKVVDLSVTATSNWYVPFENATLGALGKISITGNVELFYPAVDEYGGMSVKSGIYKSGMVKASSYKSKSQSKYPSDNLFPRDTYLVIKQEDKEVSRYHLPIKRLNSTGSVSDEFIWEYNKMKIIHRVGIATNGDYYVLAQPYEEDLGELEITIPEGDGYFVFESFPFATISITYMLKNEYTETFSTKVETRGEIKVASDEINLDVSKKLEGVSDEDGNVTSASIILAVNKDGSSAKIEADKIGIIGKDGINLEGYTTINGGFSVDKNGNMTANNGKFNGGQITLYNTNAESTQEKYAKLKLLTADNENLYTTISSYFFGITNVNSHNSITSTAVSIFDDANHYNSTLWADHIYLGGIGSDAYMYADNVNTRLQMHDKYSEANIRCGSDPYFQTYMYGTSAFSSMTPNGVWSPSFNNNSLESKKKNIELDDGCLQEIVNSDIASFNWKYEDDEDQKHIGLIIANETGKYKVSPKVLTHDKDAVDLYSMCGMSWKAIQELYDIIKLQELKIKELEERLDGVK